MRRGFRGTTTTTRGGGRRTRGCAPEGVPLGVPDLPCVFVKQRPNDRGLGCLDGERFMFSGPRPRTPTVRRDMGHPPSVVQESESADTGDGDQTRRNRGRVSRHHHSDRRTRVCTRTTPRGTSRNEEDPEGWARKRRGEEFLGFGTGLHSRARDLRRRLRGRVSLPGSWGCRI